MIRDLESGAPPVCPEALPLEPPTRRSHGGVQFTSVPPLPCRLRPHARAEQRSHDAYQAQGLRAEVRRASNHHHHHDHGPRFTRVIGERVPTPSFLLPHLRTLASP